MFTNRFMNQTLILQNRLIIVLLIFTTLIGCGGQASSDGTGETKQAQPSGVLIESVAMQSHGNGYEVVADGFLQATNQIQIISEVNGLVVEQSPQLFAGGVIEAGELMLQIEQNTYAAEKDRAQAQVESAQAAMRNAELNLNRQKDLATKQAVSEAALDQAETDLVAAQAATKQAKAALDLAEEALDDTRIEAPFKSGVINEMVSVGAFVSAGQMLAEVYDLSQAELIVGVPQSQAQDVINAFRQGYDTVRILRQDGTFLFSGQIIAVVPRLDQVARTVNFRITTSEAFAADVPRVLLGDFLQVKLQALTEQDIYLAPEIVLREERFVYGIKPDNTLKRIAVQPLSRTGESVYFTVKTPDELAELNQSDNGILLMKTDLPESYEGLKIRLSDDANQETK